MSPVYLGPLPFDACARCDHTAAEHARAHGECRVLVDNEGQRMTCFCAKFVRKEVRMLGDDASVEKDHGKSHVTLAGMQSRIEQELVALKKNIEYLAQKLEPVLRPSQEEKGPPNATCGGSQSPLVVTLIGYEAAIQRLSDRVARITGRLDLDDPAKAHPLEPVGPELPRFHHPEVYGDRPGYRRDA